MTVRGIVRDAMNRERFIITGSYVGDLVAKDLRTNHEWVIFRAPERPPNSKQMFGMNYYSLQMNYMSDQLKRKLPPTDCRLRPDMRAWEQADMDTASAEKARLE